jgi:hypothetical protein
MGALRRNMRQTHHANLESHWTSRRKMGIFLVNSPFTECR